MRDAPRVDVCGLQEEPRRDVTAFNGPAKP
jgi:hypothetical protein